MSTSEPVIAVLMATYNGEDYIRTQLDSILTQTWEHVQIYIRDDGSSDDTPEILWTYAQEHPNIHLTLSERNLGYPGCFYALTDLKDIRGDLIAFADQDDFWYPQKLARAAAAFEGVNPERPTAYYAGYDLCDDQLHPVRASDPVTTPIRLSDTLFDVCGLEFTMVINRSALELLNARKPVFSSARGTWMSMLFSAFGDIIYDNVSVAAYRRHSANVTNSGTSRLSSWIWRIRNFFGGGFNDYKAILYDFYMVNRKYLSAKERRMARLFSRKEYFPYVIIKVFFPKRLRRRLVDDLALRLVFLLGKL